MQPKNSNLPPGHISVEAAVELIKSDTRKDPVVDMDYMISRLKWLEVNGNFRIPKIKRIPAEKVTMNRYGKPIEYEHIGSVTVKINNSFEKEFLRKTILDKFRELVGHEYREKTVKATSTVADDAQGRDAVRPRANKPIAQEGQAIGGGSTVTSNGDFAV